MDKNYDSRRVAYSTDMKDMFKQIPTTMIKPLSPRQTFQKLITEIGILSGGIPLVNKIKGSTNLLMKMTELVLEIG